MTVYHHGSIKDLMFLRKGTYVIDDMADAIRFAVPWSTDDLDEEKTIWGKNGRPPKKLVFKEGREPADSPIWIYSMDRPDVEPALTNTGKFYPWNRKLKEDTRWGLKAYYPSWKKVLLNLAP